MRITINVVRRDAAALAKTAQEVRSIGTAAKGTSASLAGMGKSGSGATSAMSRFGAGLKEWSNKTLNFGKNLQWTGRQIEFRFTLPLVAAMAMGTKWALAQEAAMVRVNKVYGDGTVTGEELRLELEALGKFTEVLSNKFGKNREEVTGMMADWAAAGSAGVGLMNSTELTLETAIVGELDLAEATRSLIAIQSAYRLSTDELRLAVAQLNTAENMTQVSMKDLMVVLEEVSGVAKGFGAEIKDVVAWSASLVNITGSAAESGNALKSIMTGVMAPTGEAAQAFEEAGIALDGMWKDMDVVERMEHMVDAYGKLDAGQQAYFARLVGTKWQIAKFGELMDDIAAGPLSRYRKIQQALVTENDPKNIAKLNEELAKVMASNPQVIAQAWQQIRNSLSEIMVLVLPFIMHMIDAFKRLVLRFRELDEGTQKWILYLLMAIAVMGPLVSYIGAIITLLVVLAKAFISVGSALVKLLPLMAAHPWVLLAAALVAVVVLIYIFRDEISKALGDIVSNFVDFGQGVFNALKGLYQAVAKVVTSIYEILQYINPFARHSPSLVESVKKGVGTILDEYSKLGGISGILGKLLGDVEAFNAATVDVAAQGRAADYGRQRGELAEAGASSSGLSAFDAMIESTEALRARLPDLSREISNQTSIVDKWEAALKQADAAVESAEAHLESLTEAARRAGDELDSARAILDELSNTGILGEAAADSAIFETELAIKQLRLELLRLDEGGESVEDLADRMARLTGEIEKMRALEKSLRSAGAGSEVLGPIQAQIKALEAQRQAMGVSGAGGGRAAEIEKQIELMERQQEILELERSIKFDPLKRQLDILRDGIKELPFEELAERIRTQQRVVDQLTVAYEKANEAVASQKTVVDAARASRDLISQTFDLEREKLQQLEDAYRAMEEAISGATAAVDSFNVASAGGGSVLGPGGEFDPAGGVGGIGREGTLADMLKKLQEDVDAAKLKLDGVDLFGGIKAKMEEFEKAWDGFWKRVDGIINSNAVKILLVLAFMGLALGPFGLIAAALVGLVVAVILYWDEIKAAFGAAWNWLLEHTEKFRERFMNAMNKAWEGLKRAWDVVATFFTEDIPAVWTRVADTFDAMWERIKSRASTVGEALWDVAQKIWAPFEWAFGKIQWAWDHSIGAIWDKIKGVGDLFGGTAGSGSTQFGTGPGGSTIYGGGLASGGIVLPRPGGSIFRLGEAGKAEAVIPLDGTHGMGATINNFYGELSFPNVRDGSDADDFVRNLKTLAS